MHTWYPPTWDRTLQATRQGEAGGRASRKATSKNLIRGIIPQLAHTNPKLCVQSRNPSKRAHRPTRPLKLN